MEKTELGGQVQLAVSVPNRAEFGDIVRNLVHEIEQLPIEVRTGQEATLKNILAEQPDAVVVCTGAVRQLPPLPGVEGPRVFRFGICWKVVSRRKSNGPP